MSCVSLFLVLYQMAQHFISPRVNISSLIPSLGICHHYHPSLLYPSPVHTISCPLVFQLVSPLFPPFATPYRALMAGHGLFSRPAVGAARGMMHLAGRGSDGVGPTKQRRRAAFRPGADRGREGVASTRP